MVAPANGKAKQNVSPKFRRQGRSEAGKAGLYGKTEKLEECLKEHSKIKMKEIIDPWKDYTDRANNFADWFTAIVISNFAYLIQLVNKEHALDSLLTREKVYLWDWGFKLSCVALAFIFIAKLLSVLAASRRFHKGSGDKCQDRMEKIRFVTIIAFFCFGGASLFFSSTILHYQFIFQF